MQPEKRPQDGTRGDEGTQEVLRSCLRLWRVVEYRQGLVLWSIAISLALGAVYFAVVPRYYRAEAKLMVIEQNGDDPIMMGDQSGSDSLMTNQRELVRSPVVVGRAIEQLPPDSRIDLIGTPPHEWVDSIVSRLSSSTTRKTNIISVGYDSLDPEAAVAVVRSVIRSYLAFVDETHRGAAADVLETLTRERTELERELETKQQELLDTRRRSGRLVLPDHTEVVEPIIARAIQLNNSLIEAAQQRVELESSLSTVQSAIRRGDDLRKHVGLVQQAVGEKVMLSLLGLSDSDMAVLAAHRSRLIELEEELGRMAPYYGPAHPQVSNLRKQITEARERIAAFNRPGSDRPDAMQADELGPLLVGMLSQALEKAQDQERRMALSFREARENAIRESGDFVRTEMLEREVERLERQHDVLFEKIERVDIRQVQSPIRVAIVKEPLPRQQPSSPRLRSVFAAALFWGLAVGVGLAYLQDLLDDRFGSPDEMATQLGVRVLAMVRQLTPPTGEGFRSIQMVARPQEPESEAFRTLRTSIALGTGESERLAVSSSEPGDGKTTISANLAASYAQSGKRTLVIDADLRKPGMTALLGMKGLPGMTDVLTSSEPVSAVAARVLRGAGVDNLDVISAGPRRPDPAELLLGSRFAELVAWAEGRYDQLIIDCPPILAVSDAQIVSRLVDGVVLVVSPEKNHRRLVTRACEAFLSAGAPLLGVVANRISEQSGRGYAYGYGYGYGDAADEAPETTPAERSLAA